MRGNTTMQSVHTRQECKMIVLNAENQPIGPTKAIVTELDIFLGTLARNTMLCPLNIHNWKNMDTKEDLWEYSLEKYNIPEAAKKWTLKEIQAARRTYKNDLSRNHYKAFDNDDLWMKNKPEDVSEYDFKDLLKYWDFEKFKAEMEKIKSQQNKNDNEPVKAFAEVMGPEHSGRLSLYGRGVTRTTLKRKRYNFEPPLSSTDERMQKRVEELEERLHQVENLEQQKATIYQEVAVDILELKIMFPALQLNTDMLLSIYQQQQQSRC